MPHISYADIPLLLADPLHEVQDWIDDNLPLIDRELTGAMDSWYREGRERSQATRQSRANGWAAPNVTLPVPNYSSYRPPRWKISSLWWPTGAARHSIGLFLASDAELAQIVENLERANEVYGGSGQLIIDEGSDSTQDENSPRRLVCEQMYMLPPIRLTNLTRAQESPLNSIIPQFRELTGEQEEMPGLWLLPIVDQRYFWHQSTTGNFSISEGDTWADLFDLLGERFNTTITYDDVPAAYGNPDPTEIGRLYEDPAMMLDALAASVGMRVVFGYDSSVGLVDYLTSQDIFQTNEDRHLPFSAGGLAADWRFAAYPEKIRVVFPVRNYYQLTVDKCRNVDVDYDDIFNDQQETTSGTFKTIYSTALADFSDDSATTESEEYLSADPDNLTDLVDLAEIIAEDFWGYISAPYDITFPGVFKWIPEGFNDWVWYHAGNQRQDKRLGKGDYEYYTRACSHAINFGVTSQLSQLLDPVKAIDLKACGDDTLSVRIFDTRDYNDGDLLSDSVGEVARVLGKCFTIDAVAPTTQDAIRLPVASLQASCEGCDSEGGGGGALFADFTATATSGAASATITGDIDQFWGGTPVDTTGVTVKKLSDHNTTVFSGDKFRGVWDSDDEEWKLFWFDGMRVTIRGVISGSSEFLVNESTAEFTLVDCLLVNGWRLPGTLTVTNDPPIRAHGGDVVFARFNLTVGTGPTSNWDTGDGGNFLPKLRGIGSYDPTAIMFVAMEGDDTPKWVEPDDYSSGEQKILAYAVGTNQLVWIPKPEDGADGAPGATGPAGPPGEDGTSLTAGCGIDIVSGTISFDASAVAGPGLTFEGCQLAVFYNCSLEIGTEGVNDGRLKVHEDFPAGGLEWVDDETQCSIQAKVDNCTVDFNGSGEIEINRAIAGDYLVWSPESCGGESGQAKLNVFHSPTTWVTDIIGFAIVGDQLVLKYARNSGFVLFQTGTVIVEKAVPLTECPE